jgi:exonuclease SbcC
MVLRRRNRKRRSKMIPLNVTMEGFLSYQQPETFDFSERPLWMLSGDNGAGKSSVFDAITFVLFKEHRGGKQNAADLINWQRDRLKVSFEFQVKTERYRAERTAVRRGAATRRISRWDGAQWQILPDGTGDGGFADHVQRILGMDYATFTSSALLRQGKVDRLLDVPPPERFQLLSQIVDLSQYQELHEKAKLHQNTFRVAGTQQEARLTAMPKVTDAEVSAAEEAADAARAIEDAAQKRVNELAGIVVQAAQWETLTGEVGDLQAKVERANDLIKDEDGVRTRAARRADLSMNLPYLRDLQEAQLLRKKAGQAEIESCSAVAEAVSDQEAWAGPLDLSTPLSDRKAWLTRQFEAKITEAEAAREAIFPLKTLAQKRTAALSTQAEIARLTLAKESIPAVPDTEEAACRDESADYEKALATRDEAAEHLTRATAEREAAQGRLSRLQSAQESGGSEPACHFCGQPLSPERVREQLEALAGELAASAKKEKEARQDKTASEALLKTATASLLAAQKKWRAAVKAAEDLESKIAGLQANMEATQRDAKAAAFQVPSGPYYVRARGLFTAPAVDTPAAETWPNDVAAFPTPGELSDVEEESTGLNGWRSAAALFKRQCDHLDTCRTGLAARLAEEARASSRVEPSWLSWYESQPAAPDVLALLEKEHASLASALSEMATLDEALRDRQHWRTQINSKTEAIKNLPVLAKRAKALVEAEVKEAGVAYKLAKQRCREAESTAGNLKRQKTDRKTAEDQRHSLQQQEDIYKTLALLLGRENLQRFLLGDAERAITIYANEALSAFSHGMLRLEPRTEGTGRGGKDEALDLLCVNTESAGENALPLTNLSGSQKFRVAVALALGIGRYAGRNDARIESVIIDEGFGSLDRQNQLEMADAIRSLADDHLLKRIIVVSHQEAFADRFPDRIHVELGPNGSRQVKI